MHLVNNSAITGDGPDTAPAGLSARMQKTRLSITQHARELTAQHGFAGFTVDQLCAGVGISRRTFFNYFAAKIDAVFGHDDDGIPADALNRFMASRPAGIQGISPTLQADLVALFLELLNRDEQAIGSTQGFFAAVHREPELLERMVKVGPERQAEFLKLIAQREGVEATHPGLELLVHSLQFSAFKAVDRYLAAGSEGSLAEEYLAVLTMGREIYSQPLTLPPPGATAPDSHISQGSHA